MESFEQYMKKEKEEKTAKKEEKKAKEEQKKAKEEVESKIAERIPLFTNRRWEKIKPNPDVVKEVLDELRNKLFLAKNIKELGEALINLKMKFLTENYKDKEIQEIKDFFSEENLKKIGGYLKYLSENYKKDKVGAMKGRQKLITTLLETGIFGWPYDRVIIDEKNPVESQKYNFINLQRYQAAIFLSFLKDIVQSEELGTTYKTFLEYTNHLKKIGLKKREDDKEKKEAIFGPRGNDWKELPPSQKEPFIKNRNIMRAYKNQRYAIKVNYALEYPQLFKEISKKRLDKYYRPGVGTIPAEYTFSKEKDIEYKIKKPTGHKNIEREMEALRTKGFNKKETIEAVPELTSEQFRSYKPTFAPPAGSVYEKKRLKDIVKHIYLTYTNPETIRELIDQFIAEHPDNGEAIVHEVLEELK